MNPKNCVCSKGQNLEPKLYDIPPPLSNLSEEEADILRIFTIDVSPRKIAQFGHRVKNRAFELRYREESVEECIEAVVCAESQERLIDAFMYLYNSDRSTYQHYLSLQSDYPGGTRIKFWVVYKQMLCIECALWPVLYPFTAWCESALVSDREHPTFLSI